MGIDSLVAFGTFAPLVIAIVAAIVCNTDWYIHRKALREIRYAAELRRARRLAEIEANSAVSKWVGPLAQYGNSPPGVYVYTNRFFLCSTNQAAITGRWAGDDTGRIYLNGNPTANVLPPSWAFTNWTPVSITSGFVPGWNELQFYVTNSGYSPTGLRAELRGVACCNNCVNISCPGDIVTSVCAATGKIVFYSPPAAISTCGVPIVSVTATPPSGSFFPLGTNTVTCTAIDALGNVEDNIRRTDLLVPSPPSTWIMVAATDQVTTDQVVARMERAHAESNRSRAHAQSPALRWTIHGSWRLADAGNAFTTCFSSLLPASKASNAVGARPPVPGAAGPAIR